MAYHAVKVQESETIHRYTANIRCDELRLAYWPGLTCPTRHKRGDGIIHVHLQHADTATAPPVHLTGRFCQPSLHLTRSSIGLTASSALIRLPSARDSLIESLRWHLPRDSETLVQKAMVKPAPDKNEVSPCISLLGPSALSSYPANHQAGWALHLPAHPPEQPPRLASTPPPITEPPCSSSGPALRSNDWPCLSRIMSEIPSSFGQVSGGSRRCYCARPLSGCLTISTQSRWVAMTSNTSKHPHHISPSITFITHQSFPHPFLSRD